jgi:hypothetical protein
MRRLALVLLALLVMPAFAIAAQLGAKDLRDQLADAGCRGATSEHQVLGSRSVLAVSVVECFGRAGETVSAAEAWNRIAHAAWSSPSARFDVVFATAYRSGADQVPQSREFSSAEFARRWGPRPGRLDWVLLDPTSGPGLVLLALSAVLTAVAVPITLGIASARRGAMVFYWRSH